MAEPIGPILPRPIEPRRTDADRAAKEAAGPSFADILKASIRKVNDMQVEADEAIDRLVTGQTDNIGEVMSAVKKAELAFDTLMQIRNKLVDAFEEVMQMRI